MADATDQMLGGGVSDLVSTQKGGVQNLGRVAQALINAFPPATASTSPVVTGINTLGTTGVSVIAANALRHGILFHNPATANINIYVYVTGTNPAPTLASTGGAFIIFPGADRPFPSTVYPNVNAGFSAFAGTGTNNALTIVEFL
jgi:hypothetical protein